MLEPSKHKLTVRIEAEKLDVFRFTFLLNPELFSLEVLPDEILRGETVEGFDFSKTYTRFSQLLADLKEIVIALDALHESMRITGPKYRGAEFTIHTHHSEASRIDLFPGLTSTLQRISGRLSFVTD